MESSLDYFSLSARKSDRSAGWQVRPFPNTECRLLIQTARKGDIHFGLGDINTC